MGRVSVDLLQRGVLKDARVMLYKGMNLLTVQLALACVLRTSYRVASQISPNPAWLQERTAKDQLRKLNVSN